MCGICGIIRASGCKVDTALLDRMTDLMLLERILEELSPESRAVVTLYYLRDLPVDEVAKILDMPAGTVKTHLHRSRATLRRAWLRRAGKEG